MKFMTKTLVGLSLFSTAFCSFSRDTDQDFETDPRVLEFIENYDMTFLREDEVITLPDGTEISGLEMAITRAIGDAMGKAMGQMIEQGSKAVAEEIAKSIAESTYNIVTAPVQGLSEAVNGDSDHSRND